LENLNRKTKIGDVGIENIANKKKKGKFVPAPLHEDV
jgi:hypothetical protein